MGRQRSCAILTGTAVAMAPLFAGCAVLPRGEPLSERDCMARVMYFESNRSSEDGMLAVGTTVMNRIESGRYPRTVCGVIGQPGQFAEGALTKRMNPREARLPYRAADRVLAGERYEPMGRAMFFHTAGLTFPYTNMHYTAVAGGNAFYEKVRFAQNTLPTTRFVQEQPRSAEPEPEPARVAVANAWVDPSLMRRSSPRPAPRTIDDLLAGTTFRGESAPRVIASSGPSSDFNGRY